MTVKILGQGCADCRKLCENVKIALENIGAEAEVEYITDLTKIVLCGVMQLPALVVDEKVISSGKVLKPKEIYQY